MKIRRFFYFVAVVSVMIGLVMSPSANGVTFPGNNGKVAFVKNNHIWTLTLEGEQRFLVSGANPAWSPDGKKLAFVGQDGHIWTIKAQGNRVRQVTYGNKYKDSEPVWTKDGTALAFVRQERWGEQRSAIMRVSIDKQKVDTVSGWGAYRSPSWSPDGQALAYEGYGDAEHELIVKNLRTNQEVLLTRLSENVESHVSWSPTGEKLLFNDSRNEVYTIWPDGSHRTVLSDGDSYHASWSPDGKRVAFIEDPADDHISISEEDGTVVWVPIEKGVYRSMGAPLWSPDGTAVIFTMSLEKDGKAITDTFLLRLDSHTLVKLADEALHEATWQAR
ncbi:MAG TPA: hypothetical protein VFT59_02155 [Candidatus Saccharimonadales bacterium]|nr:hypothetical protein [Candidatus Saccharimonadales bacterium]